MTRRLLCLGLISVALIGCRGSASFESRFPKPSTAPLVGSLTRAEDCDDLASRLRADALAKLDIAAYRLASSYPDDSTGWWGFPGGGPVLDASVGLPSPGAPALEDSSSGSVRFTETNTQIAGVDEADFVETDGTHVYLLHDQFFYVLDSDPPGSIEHAAKLPIAGYPSAMFVANGRAVVFSSFYTYYPLPVADAPLAGLPYAPFVETKVTVIDVATSTPTIVSERFLDGTFLDARRHDDTVRVFLSTSTVFPGGGSEPSPWDPATGALRSRDAYLDLVETWRDTERAAIEVGELAEFVRTDATIVDGERVHSPIDCTGYYLAPSAESSSGLTRIVGFDVADPSTTSSVAIAGYAGVEYANHEAVVLVEPDYRFDLLAGIATQESAVHVFGIDGIGLELRGSGRIEGSVRDSYSVDEADGVLRIVSTETRYLDPTDSTLPNPATATTVSHVKTFSVSDGGVTPLGESPDLGAGETVQAVRFLGDTAYVVTFRQVDPLFVVDLADPAHPTLRGELTIPGFSTYIHPLGATHLLTIGQGATWGVAIQVFDVSDPTSPTQTHVLETHGTSSAAQWDPHAFVFDDVTGLLAIPMTDYSSGTFRSELRLFHVSVDGGIVPRGAIDHTAYFEDCRDAEYGYYGCAYTADVRRGLFIDEFVYTVSTRAVTATPLSDLTAPTDFVLLEAPTYWYSPVDWWRGF